MASTSVELLNGVSATGASSWQNVSNSAGILVTHSASSSPDLTVAIEGKDADGNAILLDSRAISAAGDTVVEIPVGFIELRANVTSYTAGTLSSYLNAA